ncbi:MAG: RecQ family ATP-dependent DNA helicase, partial [Polyangiales bacterium]
MTHSDAWRSQLRTRFGLEDFRPWQLEAVTALLEGPGQVLVVAPTGGGKSLCYQFPATVLGGTTVVVSPLIALMQDQVRALQARGIAATYLASDLPREERRRREQALMQGHYALVYVAPERLAMRHALEVFARLAPPLVAVDEAHCIAQWGHDFRPDYLALGDFLAALRPPRVLACTATATPQVRREIIERLGFGPDEMCTVLRGFARPNLHLAARQVAGAGQIRTGVRQALQQALGTPDRPQGAAIIYAATRKQSERHASELATLGWRAGCYHAGLEPHLRAAVSTAFADGSLDVVVATNAFGMGIDRADIRLVLHVQAPGSIEAYYQEVGRAGRDGAPAKGILLSSTGDFGLRRRLIEGDASGDAAWREHQWQMFLDVMRYLDAGSCRHDFILRYFGDEQEILGGCG